MLMQSEVAGVGRRLVALVVDLVMLMLASIPLQLGLREVTPSAVVLWVLLYLIMLCYATIFLGGRGQTPGKVMASLRVIGAEGGGVNQRQAFVRSVVKWTPIFGFWILYLALAPFSTGSEPVALEGASVEAVEAVEAMLEQALVSMAVLLLGLIAGLFLIVGAKRHPDGQAVHDRVADTYVIRLP